MSGDVAPRLICVAGDFTRYDAHAVREHRRSIDLVRHRYFGNDLIGLETVASVAGHAATGRRVRRRAAGRPRLRRLGRPLECAVLGPPAEPGMDVAGPHRSGTSRQAIPVGSFYTNLLRTIRSSNRLRPRNDSDSSGRTNSHSASDSSWRRITRP